MITDRNAKEENLSEWYAKRLARPIFFIFFLIIFLQMLLLAYQQREKNAELSAAIESLSKIFSLAISQKNRPMIEMSAAFAMQNSGLKAICIFEGDALQYMIPFDQERHCHLQSDFLLEVVEVMPTSLPNFKYKILQPRYPSAKNNLILFLVVTVLLLPIYIFILKIRIVIEADVILPLNDSIKNLNFEGLSNLLKSQSPFRISELNALIKSHHEKLVAIGEHIARESELEKEAAIGRVIGQLSHDLRAPLGNIERLLYLPDNSTIQSEKAVISESIRRMNSMIEALRRSDLELFINRKWIEFNCSAAFAGLHHRALSKGIHLICNMSVVSRLWIDLDKFERALINLASNALDFANANLSIDVYPKGSTLIIRVIDDGFGVPEDFLPRLFQRGATHGKTDGTGLGLAYVRQIMRGHGGDVSYFRENDLTIFECILPNAVESKEDQFVERSTDMGIRLLKKVVRTVAICLDSRERSESLLAKLVSFKSDEFVFIGEREKANIVVSNIESVMFEVMESDEQEYISVAQFKEDEASIIEILKLKFSLI